MFTISFRSGSFRNASPTLRGGSGALSAASRRPSSGNASEPSAPSAATMRDSVPKRFVSARTPATPTSSNSSAGPLLASVRRETSVSSSFGSTNADTRFSSPRLSSNARKSRKSRQVFCGLGHGDSTYTCAPALGPDDVNARATLNLRQGPWPDARADPLCGATRMQVRFAKMHGLGNDFMVVAWPAERPAPEPDVVRRLADRRLGVGFDQLLLVTFADDGERDAAYRIFNADGGEVEQCGNGARCIARFVAARRHRRGGELRLASTAGPIDARV